jgi:hypothetical protein
MIINRKIGTAIATTMLFALNISSSPATAGLMGNKNLITHSFHSLSASTNQQAPSVQVKNGRLVFSGMEALKNTLALLQQKNTEELNEWETTMKFSSLRKTLSSTSLNENSFSAKLPATFTTILNSQGEYQVNDKIMWVNEDNHYIVENSDEQLLSELKKNLDGNYKGISKTKILYSTIPLKNKERKLSFNKDISDIDARYQHQYKRGNTEFKIVFEAYKAYVLYPNNTVWSMVGVRIKHEYWKKRRIGRGSWNPAGEIVQKNVRNLTASVTQSFDNATVVVPPQSKSQHDGSNLDYQLVGTWLADPITAPLKVNYIRGDFEASVDDYSNSGGYYREPNASW